jgi:hypothetical protein
MQLQATGFLKILFANIALVGLRHFMCFFVPPKAFLLYKTHLADFAFMDFAVYFFMLCQIGGT